MFAQVTLQDWENLVKKQLKTEDIYAVLTKENLEGTIGGALLTVVAAGIWGMYSPYYSIQDWVALSLCAKMWVVTMLWIS